MAWGRFEARVRITARVRANARIKDRASVRGQVWIRDMARYTVCWGGNIPRANNPIAKLVGPFAQLPIRITRPNYFRKTRHRITPLKLDAQLPRENQAPNLLL